MPMITVRAPLHWLFLAIGLNVSLAAGAQDYSGPRFLSLPPLEVREVIGEWLSMPQFGPLYCTLFIVSSGGQWMAFNDCTGCGGYVPRDYLLGPNYMACIWGVPLSQQGPRIFLEQDLQITYSIRDDGRLSVTSSGSTQRSSASILEIVSPEQSLSAHWK
jgi:hypothetical protein